MGTTRRWTRDFAVTVAAMLVGAVALVGTSCGEPKTSHDATASGQRVVSAETKGQVAPRAEPKPHVHVEDESAKLSAEQRAQLVSKLERATASSKGIFAALIVPTLKGETVEQVAERTFKTWQLGDHGVLVVIAIQERKSRIETGNAVQRIITDDQASAIILDHLNPHLRQGDFYGGLDETFDTVLALLPPQK